MQSVEESSRRKTKHLLQRLRLDRKQNQEEKKIRKRKEKCGEPEAELCEEDEEEEEKDGQEVGEGCKCDPVTSGWRGT